MKIVEVKKEAIEITSEDWQKMYDLAEDFRKICNHSYTCNPNCPMFKFCDNNSKSPMDYLYSLINFLEEN